MISNRTIGIVTLALSCFVVPFAYAAFKPVTPVPMPSRIDIEAVTIVADPSPLAPVIQHINVGDTTFHAPVKAPVKKCTPFKETRKLDKRITVGSVVEWGCK